MSSAIILGIDPGSLKTGYGLIRKEGNRLIHIHSGVIRLEKLETLDRKLKAIQDELTVIIQLYKPVAVSLESIFYAKNVKSALTLAHARGVAICTAAQFEIPIHEYTPLSVKEACVGYGRATKDQIFEMVVRLLHLPRQDVETLDQTDALAVAICHIHTDQFKSRVAKFDKLAAENL